MFTNPLVNLNKKVIRERKRISLSPPCRKHIRTIFQKSKIKQSLGKFLNLLAFFFDTYRVVAKISLCEIILQKVRV